MAVAHFQFYETFEQIVDYLPESEQLKFYKAFIRYGLYGEIPKFDGKDMAIFCQVKFAIDNQKTKSGRLAENGRKGGISARRNRECGGGEEQGGSPADFKNPSESASNNIPDNYARQVFDLCVKVGIPNCDENFITFIQRDFKFALQGVRELRLHSDEFMAALENYGEVLKLRQKGRTWWERDLRLDQLCNGQKKLILNFLPGNFKIADYIKELPPEEERKRRQEEEKAESERRIAEKYKDAPKKCPECGGPVYPNGDIVACAKCRIWYEKMEGGWEFHSRREGG